MKKLIWVILCLLTLTACGTAPKQEPLTAEEISWFQTEFFSAEFTGDEKAVRNTFLTSAYESPEQINLQELFYNGFGAEISEEEYEQLEKHGADLNLDVVKVTEDQMNETLEKYAGLGLEDTEKVGLDKFYYNEELQAYYLVHSDTNWMSCQVVEGYRNDAGEVVLKYRLDGYSFDKLSEEELEALPLHQVTLKAEGDSYLFLSNQ